MTARDTGTRLRSTLTFAEVEALDVALDDLTKLALLYERRLIFKGRFQREAMLAAASRRHAKHIIEKARRAR